MEESFQVLLIVYMLLICVLGSVFNLIALVIFYINFINYSSVLIFFSLSLVNFISSLVLVPIELSKIRNQFYNDEIICSISYFLKKLFQFESELLIVLLALERYKSTRVTNANQVIDYCALKYDRTKAVTLSFLISALFASISFGFHDFDLESFACKEKKTSNKLAGFHIVTLVLLTIQLVFIVFMFVRVYLMAYKSSMKVSFVSSRRFLSQTSGTSSELAKHSSLVESIRISNFKRIRNDLRIAKLFILVICFNSI